MFRIEYNASLNMRKKKKVNKAGKNAKMISTTKNDLNCIPAQGFIYT